MWKILGGVFIGVFVGSFTVEVLRRMKPELFSQVTQKARTSADAVFSAFRNGYESPPAE